VTSAVFFSPPDRVSIDGEHVTGFLLFLVPLVSDDAHLSRLFFLFLTAA